MAETIVDIENAGLDLPSLVERAAAGEEIVIAKAGKPCARLLPIAGRRPRVLGLGKGKGWISPEFDEPLPPDIMRAFTGEE